MWRKGMKAVCVHEEESLQGFPMPLEKGAIYDVASVFYDEREAWTFDGHERAGHLVLRLSGVANPWTTDGGFCARRFRPLIEDEQTEEEKRDIVMFHRIADSGPTETREVEREYSNPRVGV